MGLADDSVTILKYRVGNGYHFHVMDKFDEPNEEKRLDRMIAYAATLAELHGDRYEELWVKTCPIFPAR